MFGSRVRNQISLLGFQLKRLATPLFVVLCGPCPGLWSAKASGSEQLQANALLFENNAAIGNVSHFHVYFCSLAAAVLL